MMEASAFVAPGRVVASLVVLAALTACGGSHGGGGGGGAVAASVDSASLPTSTAAPTGAVADTTMMTEDDEVAWINAHGFSVTKDDLHASYNTFTVSKVDPNMNVLWGTETDELRNYLALWRRTNYAPFLDQARAWRDWVVDPYSKWQSGGSNVVEKSHVYLKGIIDWATQFPDDADARAAAGRLLDFVLTVDTTFVETRVSARCIEGLAAWIQKMPDRHDEATAKLQAFLAGIDAAPHVNGFVCMKFAVGEHMGHDGLAPGQDLRTMFPGDMAAGLIDSATTYMLKGHLGVGAYQDCMLIEALRLAAAALGDTSRANLASQIASAWVPYVRQPLGQTDPIIPYYIVPDAPESELYIFRMNGTPLYETQYAAVCPDPALRHRLETLVLLRQWGKLDPTSPSELGGKPRYWPWQTWEEGYFLLQR
jgi:hypothetical protein